MFVRRTGLAIMLLWLTAGPLQALTEVRGKITTSDRPAKEHEGLVRWNGAKKAYIIKTTGGSAREIEFEVPVTSVKSVSVAMPAELKPAVQLVQESKLPQAIAALDKLAQDYLMLQWDLVATRWLAEAYVRDGKPELAVKACERVTDKRPETAISSEMAPWYWQALLAAGRNAKLEDILDLAAKSPMPDGQARANIIRGELLRKQGKSKDALRDGYLRTVVLFKGWREPSVRDARAEALYKAAQCFDDLGSIPPATRMRTICMNEHAESSWANKLKAGDR